MVAKGSIRAFLRVHPRTFRDGIRLYAAYVLSVLLQIFVPSCFGSVGRWVPGRSNLGVSVDRVHFDVRPRTNDLDLISGKYEPLTAGWFQVGIGDVVVDAGAHIGLYTLRAATKAATVVAIEPDPSNRSLLERNIRLNGFSNIIVVPKALSSRSGTRTLSLAGRANTGVSSLDPDAFAAPRTTGFVGAVLVETTTLDELVSSLGLTRINWLKVDVERHELAVLSGATAALAITRAIALEVTVSTADRCKAIVESAGFHLRLVENGVQTTNWMLTKERAPRSIARSLVSSPGGNAPANISIGICAYNEARRLPALLESLSTQVLPSGFLLKEILVVASGCTDGTERVVEDWAEREPRLGLIPESERSGKASALNAILARFRGDILVLVNADARLLPGALSQLLGAFDRGPEIEVVCGFPVPEPAGSVVTAVEYVWWRLHNLTLQTLAELSAGNYCCDELMAFRRGFIDAIPTGVVNDGAYLGVLAAQRGMTVQFVPGAKVLVAIPGNLLGLIRQRRRILRGHRQVLDLLGAPVFTLEGLAKRQPALVAKILTAELASRPGPTLAFLLLALPIEASAHALAIFERLTRRALSPAWPMVE